MKRRILYLLPLVFALGCTQAETAETADTAEKAVAADPADARQAIEAKNKEFIEHFKAGHSDVVVGYYDEGAIAMPPNTARAKNPEEIRKAMTDFHTAYTVKEFTLTTDDVQVGGDYAVETGHWTMTLAPKAGGADLPDTGNYVVVWKKQADGSWKLFRDIWNSDRPPPAASN